MVTGVQLPVVGLGGSIELLNAFIEGMFELFELLCGDSLVVVAGVRFVRVKLIVTAGESRRTGARRTRTTFPGALVMVGAEFFEPLCLCLSGTPFFGGAMRR